MIQGIIGAIIGIIGTYFVNRSLGLYRREEKLVWHELPFIEFPDRKEIGASWTFENLGNKVAQDVRIVIEAPHKAEFDKVSIVPSESAIDIKNIKKEGNKLTVEIDKIPINTTVSISALLKNVNKNDQVTISALSVNVKGIKFKDYTKKFSKKIERKINVIMVSFFIFFLLTFLSMITFTVFSFLDTTNELQTEHIVELYLKDKNYDGAIEAYKDFLRGTFFYNSEGVIYYKLAKLYALKNDYKKSIESLRMAIRKKSYLRKNILSDPFWKKYKTRKIFRNFFQELESDKS